MLDRQTVRRDVGLMMREVVVRSTVFSYQTYHPGIVPSRDPMEGWAADLANWAMILKAVEAGLHSLQPAYKVLHVTADDATNTLSKALFHACELLTQKIMTSEKALMARGVARRRK